MATKPDFLTNSEIPPPSQAFDRSQSDARALRPSEGPPRDSEPPPLDYPELEGGFGKDVFYRSARLRRSDPPWRPASDERELPGVLVVHGTQQVQRWLDDCLAAECEVFIAATPAEAQPMLTASKVEVVLADAAYCTPTLLKLLDEHSLTSSTIFLAAPGHAAQEVQRHILRHRFSVAPSSVNQEALLEQVRLLLYPRSQTRHLFDKLVAELTCADGTVVQGEVFDVSNRGLSVLIATAQGAVVPGEMISAINIKRANASVVLSGQRAVVRHIRLFDGPDDVACYKVGLELRPPAARERVGDEQVVTDPTRIAALLQEGLEGRDLVVRAMDRAASVPARFARLDSVERELILTSDVLEPLEIGDVIRASFEYRGGSYSFYASLRDSSRAESTTAYSLKLPRAISFVTQRRSMRIKPSSHSVVHLNFRLPFDGRTLQKEVVNITSSGLAFVANESTELLPVGTMLSDATVVFASGGSQQVSCIVRSLSRRGSSDGSLCGVEFCGLTATERIRLVDAVANSDMPELREADPTSFEEIWKFFLDTGFLYPEKLSSIDLATVERTMRSLLGAPPDMYKATLFGQHDRIDAHVCGLKVYSGTWILQHLAARPGGKQLMTRGRALSLAIIRHMEQLPDNEWIKIWYRPANRWPSRVYGSFARRIADPALSILKVHNYMVGKIAGETQPVPAMTVEAANEQDLAELEAYIVARGELLLLRSDDYSRSQILLPEISALFREIGLQRCREVLVARCNGRSVGFALLEISSLGLNLSDLTNTFRLVCDPRETQVQQALIWHARERYRALGYTRCVGLADDEHLGGFQTMGFEAVKRYACWTWHRSLHEAFCEHLRELRI